jgi:methyl-accepting chemotaxis protein
MTSLRNLRIGTRLALGFAIVLGLTVVAAAFSLVSAVRNAEATRLMMQSPLAKERLISDWYLLTYAAIARTAMISRTTDETLPITFKPTSSPTA